MRIPTSITIEGEFMTIDGVSIALIVIPQILYEIAHPDPRRWYRLERVGDFLNVHTRIAEDTDGSLIATTRDAASGSEGAGQ